MSYFEWLNPTDEQLEQANVLADRLGTVPYWVGDKLCVGQPDPAPPVSVPPAVSARQARLALLGAGMLDAVEQALQAMAGAEGQAARIEWEYATEIQRESPLVLGLGEALGLDGSQIDQLFITASTL